MGKPTKHIIIVIIACFLDTKQSRALCAAVFLLNIAPAVKMLSNNNKKRYDSSETMVAEDCVELVQAEPVDDALGGGRGATDSSSATAAKLLFRVRAPCNMVEGYEFVVDDGSHNTHHVQVVRKNDNARMVA